MNNKIQYVEQESFRKRLQEQLRKHCKKLNLTQENVAKLLNISPKNYQHWESPGYGLVNIFNILGVFQALDFSVTETIDVLGLPPLKFGGSQNHLSG